MDEDAEWGAELRNAKRAKAKLFKMMQEARNIREPMLKAGFSAEQWDALEAWAAEPVSKEETEQLRQWWKALRTISRLTDD